jgi:hypothetical protein
MVTRGPSIFATHPNTMLHQFCSETRKEKKRNSNATRERIRYDIAVEKKKSSSRWHRSSNRAVVSRLSKRLALKHTPRCTYLPEHANATVSILWFCRAEQNWQVHFTFRYRGAEVERKETYTRKRKSVCQFECSGNSGRRVTTCLLLRSGGTPPGRRTPPPRGFHRPEHYQSCPSS